MALSADDRVADIVPARTRLPHARRFLNGAPASRVVGLTLLALVLAFLSVYPLSMLLYGSLHSTPPGVAGVFTLDGYREIVSQQNLLTLLNTVGIALAKTIPSLILAVLLAWILARTDTPFRGTLEVLVTLPFFIPPILTAMAWGMLGNPQVGLLNQLYQWITGSTASPINVYSYGGVVWHMMQYSVPFLFLLIVDAFRAMDPSLEEAARMCGATRLRTFCTVTLQLMLPALTGAAILSFIRGIENFESPLFFGSPAGIHVITTDIYDSINQRSPPQYQYATAISFVIMALMFLIILMQWRILRGRSFQTVTGKGYSPAVMKLGKWRWATFAFCALFFAVTVVLPVSQLLIGSFFKFFGFYEWDMLTLEHYQAVAGSSEFWRAFSNTMLLGFCRGYADHAARRHRCLRLGPDQMARSPPDRRHGLVAVDDAGYRPGRGFPVGVRAAASCHSDLWDDLGAAARLHLAGNAAFGARHVQRLRSIVLRPRRVLARARGGLAADDVAHHDRAGLALLCRGLGPDLLRNHARVERLRAALFRRLRGSVGGAPETLGQRQRGTGERDRSHHDGHGDRFQMGAAPRHQAMDWRPVTGLGV